MTTFEQTFALLEKTGLNWTVNKEQLQTASGVQVNSYGLFRNDNNEYLGTVGGKYTIMQNSTLAETIVEAAEGIELNVERGGSLRGGKRVYLQAELPNDYIGNSAIKRYITALNSHDGTTSIAFGTTNQVVICENTFHMAYKSGDLTKFVHYATAEQRIKQAMLQMKSVMAEEYALMTNFRRMADTKLTEKSSNSILSRILSKGFDIESVTDISKNKKEKLDFLAVSIERELQDEGATLWGLFNGVTRYVNHVAAPEAEDAKLDYVINGAGGKLNGVAYETIMQWMDEHTAELVPVG